MVTQSLSLSFLILLMRNRLVGRFIIIGVLMKVIHLLRLNLFGSFLELWRFNMKQVIVSGSFRYVAKRIEELDAQGYKIVKSKQWSDGKWTYVMEK
jgi:hypothetical protein